MAGFHREERPAAQQCAWPGRTCRRVHAELQGGKGNSDKRLEQLSDMLEQRKVKELFTKAANKTGYYGGCFIYIDTGTEDPSLPLVVSNKSAEIKKDSKIKLVLIDPVNVTPLQYNSIDPLRDDYMIPQMWSVLGKSVHASRMISSSTRPERVKPKMAVIWTMVPLMTALPSEGASSIVPRLGCCSAS